MYDSAWRKARKIFLGKNPLCVMCKGEVIIKSANVVDHVVPHKKDLALFWDENNWQPLCKHHHDSVKQQQEKRGYSTTISVLGWPIDPNHPANRTRGGGVKT
jgi:5-methylcytosine-specific restriction enzyme A